MTTLDIALGYHARGLAVIPIVHRSKKAIVQWKAYQHQSHNENMVRQWFEGTDNNLALVMGDVSGGLVCRDFDQVDAYDRWAMKYPLYAKTLPTVETGRPGRHVYCRADAQVIRGASKSGSSIIKLDDGELRGSECYCLAPPSTHPSGANYRWIVDLGDEVPEVDLYQVGFLPCNTGCAGHGSTVVSTVLQVICVHCVTGNSANTAEWCWPAA